MRDRVDVAVVGGGVAGLTAAALAARAGLGVVVLESGASVGGRGRSRVQAGFVFNQGPHAVYRRGPGRSVLTELGISLEGAAPALPYRATLGDREGLLPLGGSTLLRSGLFTTREKLQVASVL